MDLNVNPVVLIQATVVNAIGHHQESIVLNAAALSI